MIAERAHLNSDLAAGMSKTCWQKARSCSLSCISCCQAWSWARWLCAHLCISLASLRSHTSAYSNSVTQILCAHGTGTCQASTASHRRAQLQQVKYVGHAGYFAADTDEARWLS